MPTAARHAERGDIVELALAQLGGGGAGPGEEDAAEDVAKAPVVADAGPAAAEAPSGSDHRWHGYYDQQDDEDEW